MAAIINNNQSAKEQRKSMKCNEMAVMANDEKRNENQRGGRRGEGENENQ